MLFENKERLTDDQYQWVKQAIKDGMKKVTLLYEVLKSTNDYDDFFHSIKKLYNLAKK